MGLPDFSHLKRKALPKGRDLERRAAADAGHCAGLDVQGQAPLLDETSLGLAPMVVLDIFKTLIDLHRKGITIVLVEQNAQLALKVSQHGYILENGRIVLHGKASDLLTDEKVKQAYLGKRKAG